MVDQVDQSDQGLINTFLEPATFSGVVESNKVQVDLSEILGIWLIYDSSNGRKFGSGLDYTVTSTKSLSFNIWIPSWMQGSAQSTISVNWGNLTAFNPSV